MTRYVGWTLHVQLYTELHCINFLYFSYPKKTLVSTRTPELLNGYDYLARLVMYLLLHTQLL